MAASANASRTQSCAADRAPPGCWTARLLDDRANLDSLPAPSSASSAWTPAFIPIFGDLHPMRAVKRTENGVEVVEVPTPSGEGHRDGVRVRPKATGICGSDIKLVALGPLPHILGHEIAGLLDDGTPVAIEPVAGCGDCARCRAGQVQQCRAFARTIYGIGRDGGMAEELCVERSCLVPLPATVALSSACLVEPLAVAIHACVRGRVQPGEKVAVIGAGAIGLASVAALQSLGCEVDLGARHAAQHEAGERLGAGLSLGSDYDAVFDAAGSTESLREAIERVRPRGRVILEASYFGDLVVSGLLLTMKEIELIPAMMYGWHAGGREIDSAAALLAARPELPDALITHRFPLDAAPEAFRIAADRGAGAIKVVLEC
jgi:threonine dehydrogenase-like Zn-dependent dehydrogenase